MYIKITTAGVVEQKASLGSDSLSTMQREVGGHIETLGCNHLAPGLTFILPEIVMVVNEEGKIHELPYNDIATQCLRYNSDYIVGDALILKYGLNEYGETDIVELTRDESDAVYAHLMEVFA